MIEPSFRFSVCTLKTRVEVLEMYLNINAGGTPHTEEELDHVRALLSAEKDAMHEGLRSQARSKANRTA